MAFNLSKAQHNKLDDFLGHILDGYKSGKFTKQNSISVLAHVFTAGVIDNEDEVKSWLEKPEVLERWERDK